MADLSNHYLMRRIAPAMAGVALVMTVILTYYLLARPSWAPEGAIIMLSGSLGLLASGLLVRGVRGRTLHSSALGLVTAVTAMLVYYVCAWLVGS